MLWRCDIMVTTLNEKNCLMYGIKEQLWLPEIHHIKCFDNVFVIMGCLSLFFFLQLITVFLMK